MTAEIPVERIDPPHEDDLEQYSANELIAMIHELVGENFDVSTQSRNELIKTLESLKQIPPETVTVIKFQTKKVSPETNDFTSKEPSSETESPGQNPKEIANEYFNLIKVHPGNLSIDEQLYAIKNPAEHIAMLLARSQAEDKVELINTYRRQT